MIYNPPPRRELRPNHTADEVKEWRELMVKNNWSLNKLANHLGKGYMTVQGYMDKYDAGLLK